MNGEFSELNKSVSILDRLTKMYYNRELAGTGIGWGQQFYLEYIYDHAGATAQEMAERICVDKATLTKTIKVLLSLDYIHLVRDERDKRVKHLYLTEKALPVAEKIKQVHASFYDAWSKDIEKNDLDITIRTLNGILKNVNKKVWHRMEVKDGK